MVRDRVVADDWLVSIDANRYSVPCRQMLILCALFDGVIGFSDVYDWWRPL